MRIISWNVNGIRANARKGGFSWLLNESPDVFCLQETKARPDQLGPDLLSPPGYRSYWNSHDTKKGYSGVAMYTKIPPISVLDGFSPGESDEEGRVIALEFEDLFLINTYFPNGGGGPERLAYKLDFYDRYLVWLEELRATGKAVVFCGDVNTAHCEIDLARPKENQDNTGFLPVERAWIDEVIRHGFVDAYRARHPETVAYTYWDMKTFARARNVGWRIDYFFVDHVLMDRIASVKIRSEIEGSDHCPVEMTIR